MSYLTVKDASKQFGASVRALDGVSFAVERNEFFTLLGPSGCGKTTLLRSIAGFADLTAGSISLAGTGLDSGLLFENRGESLHEGCLMGRVENDLFLGRGGSSECRYRYGSNQ